MRTLNDIDGATDAEIGGYLELVETKEFRQHVASFRGEQMTMRDHFAAAALKGQLSCAEIIGSSITGQEVARSCYEWADLMLAARKEGA
jgi:hypothetical protein